MPLAALQREEYASDHTRPRKKRRRGGGGEAAATTAVVCTVCLEDFAVGDRLAAMPCKHRFHETCLLEWLAHSHALPSEEHEAAERVRGNAATTALRLRDVGSRGSRSQDTISEAGAPRIGETTTGLADDGALAVMRMTDMMSACTPSNKFGRILMV